MTAVKKAAASKRAPTAKKAPPAPKRAASGAKRRAPVAKKAAPASKRTASGTKKPAPKVKPAAKSPAKKAAAKKAAAKKAAPTKKLAGTPAATRAKKAAPAPRKTAKAPASPPAPKKRPTTGPYAKDAKFLGEQRDLLLEERTVYEGQATDLRAEADSLALEREPGDVQFDEESGEGGTVTVDRERNLALSAQAGAAVEEIDDALRKIERKTYGGCERCFQAIPKARLRALPYARLCVACKSGGLSRR